MNQTLNYSASTGSTIFKRLVRQDRTAAADCIDAYGDFIWALARKFTRTREEAEAATLEIFQDIWRFSKRGDEPQSPEHKLISQIALRRLIRYLHKPKQESMAAEA